jgi:hypothetical protein
MLISLINFTVKFENRVLGRRFGLTREDVAGE